MNIFMLIVTCVLILIIKFVNEVSDPFTRTSLGIYIKSNRITEPRLTKVYVQIKSLRADPHFRSKTHAFLYSNSFLHPR